MKAAEFRYEKPASLAEAIALLADDSLDAMPLAGGQSLMPMMNFRMAQPGMLVDLNGLSELSGIAARDGHLQIGAMTRYAELERSPVVAEKAPLIAAALPHVAHSAIRNRGTIGGSVALADPAAELPAVLMALDARFEIEGPGGARTGAADGFFQGLYDTDLDAGEILTGISLPIAGEQDRFGFYELARRHGDYAMAGVAVAMTSESLRIAFFAVSDRPVQATEAERILAADPHDLDAAVDSLDMSFSGDLNAGADAKRHYAGVVLRRAWAGMQP